jgi:hypothetical protein
MLGGGLASVFARTAEDVEIEEDRYYEEKQRALENGLGRAAGGGRARDARLAAESLGDDWRGSGSRRREPSEERDPMKGGGHYEDEWVREQAVVNLSDGDGDVDRPQRRKRERKTKKEKKVKRHRSKRAELSDSGSRSASPSAAGPRAPAAVLLPPARPQQQQAEDPAPAPPLRLLPAAPPPSPPDQRFGQEGWGPYAVQEGRGQVDEARLRDKARPRDEARRPVRGDGRREEWRGGGGGGRPSGWRSRSPIFSRGVRRRRSSRERDGREGGSDEDDYVMRSRRWREQRRREDRVPHIYGPQEDANPIIDYIIKSHKYAAANSGVGRSPTSTVAPETPSCRCFPSPVLLPPPTPFSPPLTQATPVGFIRAAWLVPCRQRRPGSRAGGDQGLQHARG